MSHQEPRTRNVLGVLPLEDAACGFADCQEQVVAAAPTRADDDVGAWWLCRKHMEDVPWVNLVRGGRRPAIAISYGLSATCEINMLRTGIVCGAFSDYLGIVEPLGGGLLEANTFCSTHVKEMGFA